MLPFLKTGIILAVSQSFGKVPELSDWVNITCSTGATCSAQVFRIHVGISSGPAAFPGLRFFSMDTMPLMLNVMLGIEGYWQVVISGVLLSSLVNTEKNCSPSASALDDAVVFKVLSTSSGATD